MQQRPPPSSQVSKMSGNLILQSDEQLIFDSIPSVTSQQLTHTRNSVVNADKNAAAAVKFADLQPA